MERYHPTLCKNKKHKKKEYTAYQKQIIGKREREKFLNILEEFVDDFINICQPKSEELLLHL